MRKTDTPFRMKLQPASEPRTPWMGKWSAEVHGTPPEGLDVLASWLAHRPVYRPQSDGNLGLRMVNACHAAFAGGAESVVLLGGDCPWHTRAYFEKAASALLTHDVVIGTARDGGNTLLALKKLHRTLFENISWSSSSVLAETLDRARAQTQYCAPRHSPRCGRSGCTGTGTRGIFSGQSGLKVRPRA